MQLYKHYVAIKMTLLNSIQTLSYKSNQIKSNANLNSAVYRKRIRC